MDTFLGAAESNVVGGESLTGIWVYIVRGLAGVG